MPVNKVALQVRYSFRRVYYIECNHIVLVEVKIIKMRERDSLSLKRVVYSVLKRDGSQYLNATSSAFTCTWPIQVAKVPTVCLSVRSSPVFWRRMILCRDPARQSRVETFAAKVWQMQLVASVFSIG